MSDAPPTLLDLLRRFAGERPQATALLFGGDRLTFAELDRRSSQLANGLVSKGIRSGDRIAILARNHPVFYELLFAAMKIGAMMMPLNWRLSSAEVAAILADGEPHLLLLDSELDCRADDLDIIPLGADFDTWVQAQPADDQSAQSARSEPSLLLYTSGTTGKPKGVMITPDNLSFVERTAREAWGFTADSVNLVAMPLFHIGGIGYGMMALSQGGTTVLLRQPDPSDVVTAMRDHGATHGFFVPTVLERILDHLEGSDAPPPTSLERLVYGAAPIGRPTLDRALRLLGCGFDHAYGMTETAGTVISLPPRDHLDDSDERLRSIGRPFPWVELRLADPATGDDVAPGEVGEILIRSPVVAPGYWRKPAETAAAIDAEGWLRTGDAAIIDAEGYVTLVDRFKDMIVSGGENIYPREIENVLLAHPDVADVAVIGIPHERWGESPAAFVIAVTGATLPENDLRAFLRERLAHFKCPSLIRIVPELPRNPSGKVLKGEMRKHEWWSR
ncbi:class I adenylate-forming enzyme family protein [Sphingomonas humi]|uniref:Fatty acid--CoA ligase n=1 Tax=Sphingomonas humi TaxID=335630 RepID=A0ABP7RN65_9SPHN